MTHELNASFDRAAHDDVIKVIILAGDGRNFSAGHDLGRDGAKTLCDFDTVGTRAGFDAKGAEARYGREMEIYLEIRERWRNLPKPTIAQAQGKCIGGGLMLASVCDLIIASDDGTFKALDAAGFFLVPASDRKRGNSHSTAETIRGDSLSRRVDCGKSSLSNRPTNRSRRRLPP